MKVVIILAIFAFLTICLWDRAKHHADENIAKVTSHPYRR